MGSDYLKGHYATADVPHKSSGCDCTIIINRAIYMILDSLFVRATDVQPDFDNRVRKWS